MGNVLAYPAIVEATNAKAAEDASFATIEDPNVIVIGQKLWLPGTGTSDSGEVEAPTPAAPGTGLTTEQLANATYSGIYDEPVTLTNGRYEGKPFVEGGASLPTVQLIDNSTLYGDLNGDGIEDATVLLVENSGGTGVFTYVGAKLNQDGQPVDAGTILVGDRTQVKSMVIENGQVILEIVTQGPDDAQCCPTLKVRKTYALQNGTLAEIGSEELGTVSFADLSGTSWILQNLNFDQQPVLPDTEITASFAEGQISGTAGCNNYNGPVTSDGSQNLNVGLLISTRMACPEPVMNQEAQYLSALEGVSQWYYLAGQLAMSYEQDGIFGTLLFTPAPASEAAEAEPADSAEMDAQPTQVITYRPTAVPAESRPGSCFTNAIGLGREDAYRCMVENAIYDPCFVVADTETVVCGANPTTGDIGFVLALTEPLPAPDPGELAKPWLVELADGQVCGLMTGTVPGVGDRVASYGCPDQTYLFDDFQQADTWLAEKAVIDLTDDGFVVTESEVVPVSRVWQ